MFVRKQKRSLRRKVKDQKNFNFALFLGKTNEILNKYKIQYFSAQFTQIWAKMNFPQKLDFITF